MATDEVVAAWTGPVVVKCRAHWADGQDHEHRIEARCLDDATQARARIDEIRAAGLEPILQEHVDGRLGAVIGLVDDGRLRGVVQQESLGTWPTPAGVSSRAHTVAPDTDLVARCEALPADVGWTGLVELQFHTPPGGDPHT